MPQSNSGSLVPDDWEDPFVDFTSSNTGVSNVGATGSAPVFSSAAAFVPIPPINMSGIPIHSTVDRKTKTMFGFNYEYRSPSKGWDGDPYVYRIDFTGKMLGKTIHAPGAADRQGIMYEVEGKLKCPEFNMEDYFLLRKKHLIWDLASSELVGKVPDFTISAFRWMYLAPDSSPVDPRDEKVKDKIKSQFSYHIRTNKQMVENIEIAIKALYTEYEEIIKAAIAESCQKMDPNGVSEFVPLPQALGLKKEYGTIAKEFTADLFDYVMGKRWHFFNGDVGRVDAGSLLVPNYWVNDDRVTAGNRQERRYLGYGMRPSVIDWGLEPYPWIMYRINRVWNDLNEIIANEVAYGKSKRGGSVVARHVYIAGMKGDQVVMKQLSEKFLTYDENRIDLVTSLAIAELESESGTPPIPT